MTLPRILIDLSNGAIALQEVGAPAIPLTQILQALNIGVSPNGSALTYVGDVLLGNVQASLFGRRSPYVLAASIRPPENLSKTERNLRAMAILDAISSIDPIALEKTVPYGEFKWGTVTLPFEPDDVKEGRTFASFTVRQST